MDGHLLYLVWSPNNPRMVTHQKEVNYRVEILHLDLTYNTKTRGRLQWMVPYYA